MFNAILWGVVVLIFVFLCIFSFHNNKKRAAVVFLILLALSLLLPVLLTGIFNCVDYLRFLPA